MNNVICNESIIETDGLIFDPDVTFDCGQCFRWDKNEEGSWSGIVGSKLLTVKKENNKLTIIGANEKYYNKFLQPYFDLDRDYPEILETLKSDPILRDAIDFAPGIRILHQNPWETLCSFIISQNNNIPRIKGIIKRLCETFGEPIDGGCTFPSARRLAGLTVTDLAPLRSGFRAKYILDAAQKVAGNEVDLELLSVIPLDDARNELMKIKGVGPKVADCALLFGCGRLDAFPIDVWIKRVLARFYPDGFPENLKEYGGIAQQFLFHYARNCESIAKTF